MTARPAPGEISGVLLRSAFVTTVKVRAIVCPATLRIAFPDGCPLDAGDILPNAAVALYTVIFVR